MAVAPTIRTGLRASVTTNMMHVRGSKVSCHDSTAKVVVSLGGRPEVLAKLAEEVHKAHAKRASDAILCLPRIMVLLQLQSAGQALGLEGVATVSQPRHKALWIAKAPKQSSFPVQWFGLRTGWAAKRLALWLQHDPAGRSTWRRAGTPTSPACPQRNSLLQRKLHGITFLISSSF